MRIIADELAHRVSERGAAIGYRGTFIGLVTANAQLLRMAFNDVDRVSAMK